MVLAAAVSGLEIEFVDGVIGGNIDPKTINLAGEGHDLRASELGIWRAHLNVYREIVQRNITSALIMEVSPPHLGPSCTNCKRRSIRSCLKRPGLFEKILGVMPHETPFPTTSLRRTLTVTHIGRC